MHVHEAHLPGGKKSHAVIFRDELPQYKDRKDRVYLTACGQRVGGKTVYRQGFMYATRPEDRCKKCVEQVEKRREQEEEQMPLPGRLEQVLGWIDGQLNGRVEAQESVERYSIGQPGEQAVSTITIKGRRYRLSLEEA